MRKVEWFIKGLIFSRAYAEATDVANLLQYLQDNDYDNLIKECLKILKDDLRILTRDNLSLLAAKAGIPRYSRLTREELIGALHARSNNRNNG